VAQLGFAEAGHQLGGSVQRALYRRVGGTAEPLVPAADLVGGHRLVEDPLQGGQLRRPVGQLAGPVPGEPLADQRLLARKASSPSKST
jgi:hypothetical protein